MSCLSIKHPRAKAATIKLRAIRPRSVDTDAAITTRFPVILETNKPFNFKYPAFGINNNNDNGRLVVNFIYVL